MHFTGFFFGIVIGLVVGFFIGRKNGSKVSDSQIAAVKTAADVIVSDTKKL
jgi:hypothetical protein